jgi:hypothetical protein
MHVQGPGLPSLAPLRKAPGVDDLQFTTSLARARPIEEAGIAVQVRACGRAGVRAQAGAGGRGTGRGPGAGPGAGRARAGRGPGAERAEPGM